MRNRIAPLALVLAFIAVGALFGGYVTKVYIENGGNKLVVVSGGEIEVQSGGTLDLQSGAVIPALDAYALLAGDADGQDIQGFSGSAKASLSLLETEAYLLSGDGESSAYAQNGQAGINSDGAVSITASRISITSGQTPPTNADDACTQGDTIDTATFHYYCAATDTWVRVALATWP